MVYPTSFHRLVLLGTQFGDTFATGLSIRASGGGGMSAVTPAQLAAVALIAGAWWDDAVGSIAIRIAAQAKLTGIKLNRIGPDGKYADSTTMEHTYATPIAGGGTTANIPAQLATVVTLRTAIERGKASKGRMYLPVLQGFQTVGSDGRATVADALQAANGVKLFIDQLNLEYASPTGGGTPGHVAVMSNVGSGAAQDVTGTSCGRVTDTMRSRRNKLAEDPQFDTT